MFYSVTVISSLIFLNCRSKPVCIWGVCLRPTELNNIFIYLELQMRSSVVSLEHEVERLKEEIKEVETVRVGVFFSSLKLSVTQNVI